MPTLDWIGKRAVMNHHREVPYHLLRCDPKLSAGETDGGNLLVQGDNLLALKALLPYYAGRVKCIYIDPPYNTGNEGWVYNDAVNSPEMRHWLGKAVGREAEDLSRHDKWLCMMYPRLSLLREFLTEDGAIFVSIDDHEVHHLRSLMGEVFGARNFVAEFVWEGALKNDSRFVSISHDYMLCYAKNKECLSTSRTVWRTRKEGIEGIYEQVEHLKSKHRSNYEHITEGLREWYRQLPKNHPAWQHKHYSKVDARGVYFPSDISWPGGGGPTYKVMHPRTKKPVKVPARGWVFPAPERMQQAIAEDRVDFGDDETKVPTFKRYLKDTEGQVLPSVLYKDRRASMKRLRQIMGNDVFENPKDEEVLMKFIEAITSGDDIVLDSFGGSGTTAHAVLALNKLDGGNRRFILVEMDDGICRDVTARRLQRVVEGYGVSKGEKVEGLGGGFRYCTLAEPLFDETGNIRDAVRFHDLANHVFFTETGSPIPKRATGKDPLLGIHGEKAVYLLFNGVLGDKRPEGGNVLTGGVLRALPAHRGPKVIYGEGCSLGESRLKGEGITFKQVPYQVRVH